MRGEAQLFGVLGDPIEHSLSPAMHNAAFVACGLPHLYLRYRVPADALPEALADARRLRLGGVNLTVPLKEAAMGLVDELTPEAEDVGAINTIVASPRGLVGDNTDARGFLRSLAGRVRLERARVVVIGAGGSARAVGTALASAGVEHVTIANRTPARAQELADRVAARANGRVAAVGLDALDDPRLLDGTALVVNTTSAGLGDATIPMRFTATPRTCVFMDLVYGARPTAFLRAATRARRPVLDGAGMLLHQGAIAFEAWTRRAAPLDAMRRALARAGLRIPEPRPAGHGAA
jgi:shikimate dehydrogenase